MPTFREANFFFFLKRLIFHCIAKNAPVVDEWKPWYDSKKLKHNNNTRVISLKEVSNYKRTFSKLSSLKNKTREK